MKIGLFFGSFNPIHIGHLIIANTLKNLSELQQVWFVVSPQNPFKHSNSLAPDIDRLRMVELAIADNFDMRASNIEFSMPKPSYTIDTLTYLKDQYPQHQFYLIIGEDNLIHFHKWKNYEQILEYFGLLVYPRPDTSGKKLSEKAKKIKEHPSVEMIHAPLINISATYIRDCIKKEISIKYLVPKDVEEYIAAHKLFM